MSIKWKLELVNGFDLAIKDSTGSSDPYCKIEYLDLNDKKTGTVVKSKVIKQDLNPIWNFTIFDSEEQEILSKYSGIYVEVWDKDLIGKDDFMGQGILKFSEIKKFVKDDIINTTQLTTSKLILESRKKKKDRVSGFIIFRSSKDDPNTSNSLDTIHNLSESNLKERSNSLHRLSQVPDLVKSNNNNNNNNEKKQDWNNNEVLPKQISNLKEKPKRHSHLLQASISMGSLKRADSIMIKGENSQKQLIDFSKIFATKGDIVHVLQYMYDDFLKLANKDSEVFDEEEYREMVEKWNSRFQIILNLKKDISKEERKYRERQFAIKEIFETECQFNFDCMALQYEFKSKLKNVLTGEELDLVFSNIDAITPISKQCIDQLAKIVHKTNKEQCIGKFFIDNMDKFFTFTDYCINQPNANALAIKLRGKSSVKKVLDKIESDPDCKGLKLEDYLIKPVQRICKYPLLIRAVLKTTSEDHPDFQNLETAYNQINNVLDRINSAKAVHEDSSK
eukprot:TRINITY_DN1959_c3_g1_i1.p1 TRINITY_DN1959_c3_g1~~TRINITY_DN1959_c3_g1_i1.p1  ORF type:complete len:506 (+),score=124.47 TRINITY_DN1959_c3_g1_i1:18-1535(+)